MSVKQQPITGRRSLCRDIGHGAEGASTEFDLSSCFLYVFTPESFPSHPAQISKKHKQICEEDIFTALENLIQSCRSSSETRENNVGNVVQESESQAVTARRQPGKRSAPQSLI